MYVCVQNMYVCVQNMYVCVQNKYYSISISITIGWSTILIFFVYFIVIINNIKGVYLWRVCARGKKGAFVTIKIKGFKKIF